MTPQPDVEVRLDPAQFGRLLRDVRAFDQQFYKATRRRLRDVGDPAVKDVRRRILSGAAKTDVGLRRGLAAGTSLRIRTGAKTAGISITTTGAKLPPDKQPMVRAFDKASFKHRVYGTDTWVTQSGRPYFGVTLDERQQPMQHGVELALADAAATIHAAEVTNR